VSAPLVDRVGALGLLHPGAPVAVAFSGGRDSLCLLDVAVALAGPAAVLAVHVHHGLRGRDADADARGAADVARGLGATARVVRLRPPAPPGPGRGGPGAAAGARGPGSGPSPVPWARDARRAALRGAADAWGGPGTPVLVGHTASDQAETVLLRAISSPGARSLAGMAARDPGRGVLRPLLEAGVTRAEAGAWCAARGLAWRDDPTNPGTPRGRVRALLEGLEDVDGRAGAALVRTGALAREDDDALRAAAGAEVEAAGRGGVPRERLAGLPTGLGRRVLRRLAEDAVHAPCPRAGARLEDVLALRQGPGGRAALDLGDGARAVLAAGRIRCERSPPRG
jgi:tRNA(Ile)-lysidine synthase